MTDEPNLPTPETPQQSAEFVLLGVFSPDQAEQEQSIPTPTQEDYVAAAYALPDSTTDAIIRLYRANLIDENTYWAELEALAGAKPKRSSK